MTPKQKKVVEFIQRFSEKHGFSPTLEEIAREMRVCKITVLQYLRALERQKIISRQRYGRRAIEITSPEYRLRRATQLPLLGRIAAGSPIEAVEVPETIDLAEEITAGSRKDLFVLQVKGNSMVEDGIFDGDYVIIEKRETADNGETVVALLPDGSATLKKLHKEKNRVKLLPANSRLKPIYAKSITIQGVAKGVLRLVRKQ
jgi:repressor LexA